MFHSNIEVNIQVPNAQGNEAPKRSPLSVTLEILIVNLGFKFVQALVIGKMFIDAGFYVFQLSPEYNRNESQAERDWSEFGVNSEDTTSASQQTANGVLEYQSHGAPLSTSLNFSLAVVVVFGAAVVGTLALLYDAHRKRIIDWANPLSERGRDLKIQGQAHEQNNEPNFFFHYFANDAMNSEDLKDTWTYKIFAFPHKIYREEFAAAWNVLFVVLLAQSLGLDDYCASVGKAVFESANNDKLTDLQNGGNCVAPYGSDLTCRGTAGNSGAEAESAHTQSIKMSPAGQTFYFSSAAIAALVLLVIVLNKRLLPQNNNHEDAAPNNGDEVPNNNSNTWVTRCVKTPLANCYAAIFNRNSNGYQAVGSDNSNLETSLNSGLNNM